MTLEIGLVFLIVLMVIVLFVFEVFPMDKIAFCTLGALVLSGLVSPEEAISGFSNSAVITILCLMVIAAALEQNGVISWMANGLKRLRTWPMHTMAPGFMSIAGTISAFISSTAVVIVFVKIMTELSDKYGIPKGKLLLPISFASILGGSCTLMGTSTNLIVNAIYSGRTGEKLGFFEFTWLGAIFLGVSVVLITLMRRLLPAETDEKLKEAYEVDEFIATIELRPDSRLIGKPIHSTFLGKQDLAVLKLYRDGKELIHLDAETRLQTGDRLLLSCDLSNLLQLKSREEVLIASDGREPGTLTHQEFRDDPPPSPSGTGNSILVELMMLPGARFLGETLEELRTQIGHDAIPIAIKKRKNLRFVKDRIYADNLGLTRLKVGDRVLMEIDKNRIRDFDLYDNVAILQQYEAPEIARSSKRNTSLAILLVVIALAATGILSILASALLGCVALLLTGCIDLDNAYRKVDWQIIFLLAGMIPLGVAMSNTGADAWLSVQLSDIMSGLSPVFSLGILFLTTMLLSGFVSNNASAIIMAPLAITLSQELGAPVKPYILAVMFAANFSFFTPVGYQTNALVYSMGLYQFRHFLVIGGAISLVLWILATLLLQTML